MTKRLLFQVMVILIMSGCSSKNKDNAEMVYDGTAYIKLTINNLTDTTTFMYKATPTLPYVCVINKKEIARNGDYLFSYKTTIPDYIEFHLEQDFQTYIMPNDTLKIVANFDSTLHKDKAITIEGVYGDISSYYAAKQKSLGYWNIGQALANFSDPSYTLQEAFTLSDSIFRSEDNFLINFKKNHNLPDWFCNITLMNNEYLKIQIRPVLIDQRKYLFHENISNPESYYIFNKMPVYNPDAKLSRLYYDYLDVYFGYKHEEDLLGKSGLDRMLPLFKRSVPDAGKELKGEILEYYLASRLSNLILSCRQITELDKVDSVFNSTKIMISNKVLVDMLKAERERNAEYINTARTNNPFSFPTIISKD